MFTYFQAPLSSWAQRVGLSDSNPAKGEGVLDKYSSEYGGSIKCYFRKKRIDVLYIFFIHFFFTEIYSFIDLPWRDSLLKSIS